MQYLLTRTLPLTAHLSPFTLTLTLTLTLTPTPTLTLTLTPSQARAAAVPRARAHRCGRRRRAATAGGRLPRGAPSAPLACTARRAQALLRCLSVGSTPGLVVYVRSGGDHCLVVRHIVRADHGATVRYAVLAMRTGAHVRARELIRKHTGPQGLSVLYMCIFVCNCEV